MMTIRKSDLEEKVYFYYRDIENIYTFSMIISVIHYAAILSVLSQPIYFTNTHK